MYGVTEGFFFLISAVALYLDSTCICMDGMAARIP